MAEIKKKLILTKIEYWPQLCKQNLKNDLSPVKIGQVDREISAYTPYAYTHARTHASTHARTQARTHARKHARKHAHTHARTHASTHARTYGHFLKIVYFDSKFAIQHS